MAGLAFKLGVCFCLISLFACGDMLNQDFDNIYSVGNNQYYNSADILSIELDRGRFYPAGAGSAADLIAAPIPYSVQSSLITIRAVSSGAAVKINGEEAEQGAAFEISPLAVGSNNVVITVTAEDDVTVNSFLIDIYRSIPVFKSGASDYGNGYAMNPLEDGSTMIGEPWPDPRFVENGYTVADRMTGLEWVKNPGAAGDMEWEEGAAYCAGIELNNFSDWIMPNREELRTLVNYGAADYSEWISAMGFENAGGRIYFSSTTLVQNTGSAWAIETDNSTGYIPGRIAFRGKDTQRFVWPVRGSSRLIPVSGQGRVYISGDDGSLARGVKWPAPRFADNLDGTITDLLTGLTWMQQGDIGGICSWRGAINRAEALNSGEGTAGYTDWRLPGIHEIATLINSGAAEQDKWLISQGFTGIRNFDYWSSTSSAQHPDYAAWYVNAREGGIYSDRKNLYKYILPVRGPGM